jgi:hypothetical protein
LRARCRCPRRLSRRARLLPLKASPNLRVTAEQRTFHHHIPGALQVSYEPLRDDVSHEGVRVMPALAAFKLKREGERRREVIRIGGRELFILLAFTSVY